MKIHYYLPVFLLLIMISHSHGAIVIAVTESGNDVIVTAGGSANIDSLTLLSTGAQNAYFNGGSGIASVGPTGTASFPVERFSGLIGPTSFGTGTSMIATSGTGDRFGVNGSTGLLTVPNSYLSGDSLSATSVYESTTVANLGLASGTYFWSWGIGKTADSLELTIVPEPSNLALFGGVAALSMTVFQRRAVK